MNVPNRSKSEIQLGDLCKRVTVGHVGPMADQYLPNGIPFLRSQDVQPFTINTAGVKFIDDSFNAKLRKSVLATNDVVIVRTGYPGTAAVVPKELDGANCADLVILTPGPQLDPWFTVSLFNSAWGRGAVAGNLVGVAQQHFNVGAAKALRVRLPELSIQRRIGQIIKTYCDLIEVNTRRIEILEEMAQLLFDEWFGEPIWRRISLGSLIDLDKGLSYKGEGLRYGGPPMVNLKNIRREGGFVRDGTKSYVGDFKARHTVKPGDIVIANTDLTQARTVLGSAAIVPDLGTETMLFTHHLYAVRAKGQASLRYPHFLYGVLQSQDYKNFARGHATGTTVLGLPREAILNYQVSMPSEDMLSRFEQHASSHRTQIDLLERSSELLARTRNYLLPKLISGEIDVSGPQRQLGRAAKRTAAE